ncbi:TetR/AcrR family transcriptional regulator [bacterium]|nr:TetR/AcrR family transcriptional regulator [bacterium]
MSAETTARLRLARAAEGRPRRGTPEGTRERLIAAAAEVLNRDGYFGTDSNAIARAAGYSPATFYKHFEDKRAILLAAYERWVGAEWRHVAGTVRAGLPAAEAARHLTTWVIAHHRRWRGLRASLLALVGVDDVVRAFYLTQRRRQLEWLAELRRPAAAASAGREADALRLYTFERACDAIANGETAALGLDAERFEALIAEQMAGAWRA